MEYPTPKSLCFSYEPQYGRLEPGSVKKALVIHASPRKEGVSKTGIFAGAFIRGLEKAGTDVEMIHLRDKKVNQCQGCFTCWTKTPGQCIFNDDAAEIMERAERADLVVYASPLYHFGVIALLKKYIERTLPVIQPFLVEREDGKTTHPPREGRKAVTNIAILGVCGFPEVSHFGAFSAHFHYIAKAGGNNGYNIVAEIYRPMCEVLNNPFYAEENERVLKETEKAGFDLVTRGFVAPETVDAIAEVPEDKRSIHDAANASWNHCIREGITMPEFQQQLLES